MPKLSAVLLVDDDPTTNFLHKLLLQQMEVAEQLLVAENGVEALRILTATCLGTCLTCPALILLDINMPVMNGLVFLDAYQQLALPIARPPVIVVLTTSMNAAELAHVQQQPLVAGLLSKPLTRNKVTGLLQHYFSG